MARIAQPIAIVGTTDEREDAVRPPRDDWSEERGGRIDPLDHPDPGDPEEKIDHSIAESFPASDPPSHMGK